MSMQNFRKYSHSKKFTEHVNESLQNEPHPNAISAIFKAGADGVGPTGYPFEDFVAEILESKGYTTQIRSTLMGQCVNHEIDVIAKKGTEKLMVEANFIMLPGFIPMYMFLYIPKPDLMTLGKISFTRAWLFTNTKLPLTHGRMHFVSVWGYRLELSAKRRTQGFNWKGETHPITILALLSQSEKQTLLENHIVLVNQVLKNEQMLDVLGIPPDKKTKIAEEAKLILNE